jgi:cell division protein FtsW
MKKVQKEGKEDELLILFVAILTLAGLFFYIVQVHIMEK